MIKKKIPSNCYSQNQEEEQISVPYGVKEGEREQVELMGLGD